MIRSESTDGQSAVCRAVKGSLGIVACVLVGMAAGATMAPLADVQAEVRRTPPREHFKSGGQVSVPILKEIAGTLLQIDARLARLEATVGRMEVNQKQSLDGAVD